MENDQVKTPEKPKQPRGFQRGQQRGIAPATDFFDEETKERILNSQRLHRDCAGPNG